MGQQLQSGFLSATCDSSAIGHGHVSMFDTGALWAHVLFWGCSPGEMFVLDCADMQCSPGSLPSMALSCGMMGPVCFLHCEAGGTSMKARASLPVGGRRSEQSEGCCKLAAALGSMAIDSDNEAHSACVSGPARSLR